MSADVDEFIPTRKSLLDRLRNWDDERGWRDFFDTYWKLIYGVARKAGLSDAEAQDAVQETIISVARKMPGFVYDPVSGSFKAWLMQVTRRRISDQFRKKHYQAGDKRLPREEPLDTTVANSIPAPDACNLESIWDNEWQKHLLEAALERIKAHANPKQFQMFYLHVSRRIPARDVAQRLGVKLAEVYFAKYKISALLRKEIKRLENRGI
jgi:RNA polymerase sigma factor (sigma-70 family)